MQQDLTSAIDALRASIATEQQTLEIMAEAAFLMGNQPLAEELAEQADDIARVQPNLPSLIFMPGASGLPTPSGKPSAEERGMKVVLLHALRMLACARIQDKSGDLHPDQLSPTTVESLLHKVERLYQLSIDSIEL